MSVGYMVNVFECSLDIPNSQTRRPLAFPIIELGLLVQWSRYNDSDSQHLDERIVSLESLNCITEDVRSLQRCHAEHFLFQLPSYFVFVAHDHCQQLSTAKH